MRASPDLRVGLHPSRPEVALRLARIDTVAKLCGSLEAEPNELFSCGTDCGTAAFAVIRRLFPWQAERLFLAC